MQFTNLESFISDIPDEYKTPSMIITITNSNGEITTHNVPSGFQWDRYLNKHFEKYSVCVSKNGFRGRINGNLLEGRYTRPLIEN